MNFVGGLDGMNFAPVTNYNKYLHGSKAFEVDTESMDFENILKQQTNAMQSPLEIQGGVQINKIDDVVARNSVQSVDGAPNAGNLLKSFSNSFNGGLNSVNDAVKAANKAQEEFAMGGNVSVHDVMIASEKASLSMQMAMQLRNKLMTAYNEINNIKV